MKKLLLILILAVSGHLNAQIDEHYQDYEGLEQELGLDGAFNASTFGGTFALGLKYGWKLNDIVIAGPSLRYQFAWAKPQYNPTSATFHFIGAGGFLHARLFNVFFVGTELEFFRSPRYVNGVFTGEKKLILTGLIGGGYSMEFNEAWRLNLGIFYDVVNSESSPLRPQYFLRTNNGQVLQPVIYRVNFFIPIRWNRDRDDFNSMDEEDY